MMALDEFRERARTARERLHRIPATGPGELGAPDPATGERWHRGNVLGHVAEMLPFWTDQVRAAAAGAGAIGRGEPGYQQRKDGIARGTRLSEDELRAQVEGGLDELDALLSTLTDEDLERPVAYGRRDGSDEMTLGAALDQLLVRHFEEHLDQLETLT
jgi:DinB superfamily